MVRRRQATDSAEARRRRRSKRVRTVHGEIIALPGYRVYRRHARGEATRARAGSFGVRGCLATVVPVGIEKERPSQIALGAPSPSSEGAGGERLCVPRRSQEVKRWLRRRLSRR